MGKRGWKFLLGKGAASFGIQSKNRMDGGSPPPSPGDALLLESGDYLLLESGDKLLLEA